MQDTSPAANQRPEPVGGRDGDGQAWVAVTWLEDDVDEPVDTPLIALLPVPDSP
ncbi:hypothetical protein [Actinophytocola sp.]|uniref:hypothetical protein n=1 Tax=Actinophytocola sp. TaxID=1872138 RepID=UPI0025BFBD74|nr:hypothetical protein [Actinophytocola sp.]